MKQKMMKALGATALGAVFTVTAAGVASAALVPGTTDVLNDVPVDRTAEVLAAQDPTATTDAVVDTLGPGASLPL